MGKAYSEQEREEVRTRLLEAGVAIFHEEDAGALNIREVSKRAGISLGGFYSFYPDKESFVLDVMIYRVHQKEDWVRTFFSTPSEDPAGQLAELIVRGYLDIYHKIKTKKIYRDSMKLITGASGEKHKFQEREIEQFVSDIADLWKKQGYSVRLDVQGVAWVIHTAGIMILSGGDIADPYFEEILRDIIRNGIRRYIKAEAAGMKREGCTC